MNTSIATATASNTSTTALIFLTIACWVIFPAIAAAIAFLSFSLTGLIWILAGAATLSVVFEAPREWILDRFQ